MASKFMVGSALEARLLLRPSHQRAVSFGITYKLGRPITGRPMRPLVLGFKAYSGSSLTPPLPKDQSSQSSTHEGKSRFWDRFPRLTAGATFVAGTIVTGVGFVVQQVWFPDWYGRRQRVQHESDRESAILEKLKMGPEFPDIRAAVLRESLVEKIKMLIIATETSSLYPLIIGEHGTGKTSLIQLAIESMDKGKPKGIAYVDLTVECNSEMDVVAAMQEGLGWQPNPIIDSNKPASIKETLRFFSYIARKYAQEYKQVPVLIIDNVNRLAENQQEILNVLQNYAKSATDRQIATVVFVSSEGCVPHRMRERSAWSRHGQVLEVDDMTKEEALQFLKLRKLNEKQAAEIYEFVGGRIIHLREVADNIEKSRGKYELQAIRQEKLTEAGAVLQHAEMLPGCRYYKEGAVVIRELLKNGSIPITTYYSLVDPVVGQKLLELNVFASHPVTGMITFQSTIMKRYCEENPDLWKKNIFGR